MSFAAYDRSSISRNTLHRCAFHESNCAHPNWMQLSRNGTRKCRIVFVSCRRLLSFSLNVSTRTHTHTHPCTQHKGETKKRNRLASRTRTPQLHLSAWYTIVCFAQTRWQSISGHFCRSVSNLHFTSSATFVHTGWPHSVLHFLLE